MSLKQICDLAYVLILEKIERTTETDRIITALEVFLSGEGGTVELPSAEARKAEFDKALSAPPKEDANPDQVILMRALGIGVYGRRDAR